MGGVMLQGKWILQSTNTGEVLLKYAVEVIISQQRMSTMRFLEPLLERAVYTEFPANLVSPNPFVGKIGWEIGGKIG